MTNEQPRLGVMYPEIRMVKFKSTASVYPPLAVHPLSNREKWVCLFQSFRNNVLSVTNSVTDVFCNSYVVTKSAAAPVSVTMLLLQKWPVTRFVTRNLLKLIDCDEKSEKSPGSRGCLSRRGKGDSDSLTIRHPGYGAYCQRTKRQRGGVMGSTSQVPSPTPSNAQPQASFVLTELTGGVSSWL
jgi:hypothetical protein